MTQVTPLPNYPFPSLQVAKHITQMPNHQRYSAKLDTNPKECTLDFVIQVIQQTNAKSEDLNRGSIEWKWPVAKLLLGLGCMGLARAGIQLHKGVLIEDQFKGGFILSMLSFASIQPASPEEQYDQEISLILNDRRKGFAQGFPYLIHLPQKKQQAFHPQERLWLYDEHLQATLKAYQKIPLVSRDLPEWLSTFFTEENPLSLDALHLMKPLTNPDYPIDLLAPYSDHFHDLFKRYKAGIDLESLPQEISSLMQEVEKEWKEK